LPAVFRDPGHQRDGVACLFRRPAQHTPPVRRFPGDDTDRPWRKSRLAARILFRKEAGRMTARDRRIARVLAADPEVTNRPI
jgi:hypothetical protein